MRTREILAAARRDGKAAGKAAASWVFDGNTKLETYQRFLKGIEDGDPEILDSVRAPDLSGEFAGDPTPTELAERYGVELETEPDNGEWFLQEVTSTYIDAADAAFWGELERTCREQVKWAQRQAKEGAR